MGEVLPCAEWSELTDLGLHGINLLMRGGYI